MDDSNFIYFQQSFSLSWNDRIESMDRIVLINDESNLAVKRWISWTKLLEYLINATVFYQFHGLDDEIDDCDFDLFVV